jgi:hypothetical protein
MLEFGRVCPGNRQLQPGGCELISQALLLGFSGLPSVCYLD